MRVFPLNESGCCFLSQVRTAYTWTWYICNNKNWNKTSGYYLHALHRKPTWTLKVFATGNCCHKHLQLIRLLNASVRFMFYSSLIKQSVSATFNKCKLSLPDIIIISKWRWVFAQTGLRITFIVFSVSN